MLSAKSPEGAKFATSPILKQYNKDYAEEQAAVKGKGTATRKFTPTKDIYAIKTKDGGVLVTGGMGWQAGSSLTGNWEYAPEKSSDTYTYRLHPTPYQSELYEYNAMWAVQVPVKGPLKLLMWDSEWANFSAS
jgi:hypothetical protein